MHIEVCMHACTEPALADGAVGSWQDEDCSHPSAPLLFLSNCDVILRAKNGFTGLCMTFPLMACISILLALHQAPIAADMAMLAMVRIKSSVSCTSVNQEDNHIESMIES